MSLSGYAAPGLVVGVTVTLTILAICAILSRLFTRRVIVHNLGCDDAFVTGALLLSLGLTFTTIVQVQHGIGLHDDAISNSNQSAALKPTWASFVIFNVAIALAQESILIQFLRIFPHGLYRNICGFLMLVVLIQGIWSFWTSVFFCTPISYFWLQAIDSRGGKCLNETTVWCITAAVNTIIYLAIGFMPIPVLQALEMPRGQTRGQKYSLMLVFCLPGLTCVFSTLRLEFLYLLSTSDDFLYNAPMAAIWTTAELNFAILASCTPTLKACLGRIFPRLMVTFQVPQRKASDPSTSFPTDRTESRNALIEIPERVHLHRKPTNGAASRFTNTERISIEILARELGGVSIPAPSSPLSTATTARSSPLLPLPSASTSQTYINTQVTGGGSPLTLSIPPSSAGGASYYRSNPTTPLSASSEEGYIYVTTIVEPNVQRERRRSSGMYSAQQWMRERFVLPTLPEPQRADMLV